jgi:Mor family transcriptional regulator
MSDQAEIEMPADDMADLLAHAGENVSADKWPATLAEMTDLLFALYVRRGRSEADALAEAKLVVLTIAEYHGGRPVYLPRGDRLRIALRNREIFLRHHGNNGDALAREYNLTLRQVQSIVAEQHALCVRRMQGNLFNEEGARK